jgi:endonuclease/exonuclease/phosphatase family metal-dependent hydrolase
VLHLRWGGRLGGETDVKTLRFLTLNLWGAEPPLEARMAAVCNGLRELAPDVVALQEVREVPGALPNQAVELARTVGYHVAFAPATPFGGGHEGLAILAREPILEHAALELPHAEEKERRILLSARVKNGANAVWVHTTHLNYRLAHGKQREDQVQAIEVACRACQTDSPQILMGDFNACPEADEIRFLRGQVTLAGRRSYWQDAWERMHRGVPGWTWSRANPYTAKLAFLEPDRRLDYIFITPMRGDGRATVHSCHMVFDQPSTEGVYASDHFGLLAEIQVEPS